MKKPKLTPRQLFTTALEQDYKSGIPANEAMRLLGYKKLAMQAAFPQVKKADDEDTTPIPLGDMVEHLLGGGIKATALLAILSKTPGRDLPRSRAAAFNGAPPVYYTGKTCQQGHRSLRRTATGYCLMCWIDKIGSARNQRQHRKAARIQARTAPARIAA